jgi:23S rRNA (cytidine1920-2'-O)/16S rRNA (cytidine1409-2'-O)-methyltransferase
MIKKSRLDLYLIYKGLCETRQKAQGLILAGKVKDINGKIFDKPGQQVLVGTEFIIESEPQFVSRGGEKLLEAFKKLNINVKDRVCIDAGISTGGFTDCLLQQGAKMVYGIDVGYGQTAWKIRNNPKVKLFERSNIRNLKPLDIYSEESLLPNFVVADLSFISLKLVFEPINNLLSGDLIEGIFLIKPQFEVGKDRVSKGGVVRKAEYHIEAIESVINAAEQMQWNIQGLVASPLVGPAGNHEYLAWMSKIRMSNPKIDINFIENLVQETL